MPIPPRQARLLFVPLLLLLLAPCGAAAFGAEAQAMHRARSAAPQHFDRSPPLAEIAPRDELAAPRLLRRPGRSSVRRAAGQAGAPARPQAAPGERRALAMPSASRSFEGLGLGFSGPQGRYTIDGDPPDTNGDIGPNHYVQIVNSSLAVFDRSGNVLYGPVAINTLWSGFGGACETGGDGDPIVKYDKRADRWVVSQFAVSAAPYLECVAVSSTGDPTGAYYRYSYAFTDTNDYPKLGIWPDGYYFTFNMFDANSNSLGGEVCVLNRAAMLTGAAATKQCFGPNPDWYGMLPADLDGPLDPPPGSPNYVMNLDPNSSTALGLWKLHVDWATPSRSTFVGPTSIVVQSYTDLCINAADSSSCIPQLGTTTRLDGLGDRLMYRLAYRNMSGYETLVVNHSIDQGNTGTGAAAIRWYEVRSPGSSPQLYQQGTYAPDAKSRWMGSMAMDGSGNIALGYSVSSAAMYPAIAYTGRLHGDPLNTLPQGETTLISSTGYHYDSTGIGRWGDYSSLSVDPVDDCTFWYTNEYFTTKARDPYQWQTRIGSFKFPSCVAACSYALQSASLSLTAAAAAGSVALTTTAACAWTAAANASWITLSSSGSGSGNATVNFTVAANSSPLARSGTLTAGGQTYTVNQAGSGLSDCLFNWAEAQYQPLFLRPGTASTSYPPYYYRYYPATGNYLASSSADDHIWVLGPSFGNSLRDVGAVASFLGASGCQ